MHPKKRLAVASALLVLVALVVQATLVLTASPMLPVRAATLLPDAATAPTDPQLWLATLFAPWIWAETDPELGRQDVPSAMDFDGDTDGTNDWEDLPRFELVPTVYYTIVESESHYFLSYHLYHPRDWARVQLGIEDTHEGDGENLQVVVEKANMSAVLLTTQAHYRMWSYGPFPGAIRSAGETMRGDFEIATGHPIVFVESGGHGIYGSHDPRAANRMVRLQDPIVTYRPANVDEVPKEPQAPWNESAPYRLVSLPAFLANSTDHPDLFAGAIDHEGHSTPRYHKGDRYAGPLGSSRGISPFALGYGWSRGELGSLFWTPAERYQAAFEIQGNWSTRYMDHPFLP